MPSAAGTIPDPTAAAEPLEEPPGVRSGSNGFVVGPGSRDGELSRDRLADYDSPTLSQHRDTGGVIPGQPAVEKRGIHLRRHVGRRDDVLDGYRASVNRRQGRARSIAPRRGVGARYVRAASTFSVTNALTFSSRAEITSTHCSRKSQGRAAAAYEVDSRLREGNRVGI